jgi:hypothetical protein
MDPIALWQWNSELSSFSRHLSVRSARSLRGVFRFGAPHLRFGLVDRFLELLAAAFSAWVLLAYASGSWTAFWSFSLRRFPLGCLSLTLRARGPLFGASRRGVFRLGASRLRFGLVDRFLELLAYASGYDCPLRHSVLDPRWLTVHRDMSLAKNAPNRHNRRHDKHLRAASRATKPGRRDMDREAVTYQPSAISRAPNLRVECPESSS